MSPSEKFLQRAAICPPQKFMGTSYMSAEEPFDWDGPQEDEDDPRYGDSSVEPGEDEEEQDELVPLSLEILCNMDDPPGEAFETSYRRAQDLLADAGPKAAILLLTIEEDEDDNLASSVVLSSGYARIPTNTILGVLDAHLGALWAEDDKE